MRFKNKIMVVILVALMHLLELAGAFSHYCACCKPKIGSSSHVSVMLKSKATNEMDVDTKSVTNGEFDIDSDIDTDSMDANAKSYRPGSLAAATAEQGRVPYGEESRRYRRTEFVYEDWVTHRTTEKVFSNLNGLFYSGIVRQLKEELALVALSAALIIFWNDFILISDAAGTSDWISILPRLSLPALPFTLCSPALGLLLVFKTNASYARWLEGRNTWAKIISQARNIVRMTTTFVDVSRIDDDGRKSIQDLSNAVWLLCRSLMNDLSGPEDEECFRREVTKIYMNSNPCEGDEKGGDSELVVNIMKSSDRTMAALAQSSRALDTIPIDEKRRVEIDKSLVIIGDCIGTCEKIYSSPVPLVYTRHTGRFLSLWMLLLPAALHDVFIDPNQASSGTLHFLQCLPLIPTTVIVGLFLFGIDELALQLEEPFSILPMQKFCDRVRQSSTTISEWNGSERT